ncbi:MAG: hypothetical protein V8S58_09475 [Lachnospiraceae bacterium]
MAVKQQVFDKKHLQQENPNPWIENDSWLPKRDTSYQVPFGGFTVTSRLYDLDVTGYNNHSSCISSIWNPWMRASLMTASILIKPESRRT